MGQILLGARRLAAAAQQNPGDDQARGGKAEGKDRRRFPLRVGLLEKDAPGIVRVPVSIIGAARHPSRQEAGGLGLWHLIPARTGAMIAAGDETAFRHSVIVTGYDIERTEGAPVLPAFNPALHLGGTQRRAGRPEGLGIFPKL